MRYLIAVVVLVAACTTAGAVLKDVPPTGQIWFGQSFDPTTFALTGKRTTAGTQEPVALVAHLTKGIDGSTTIRASLNGTFVTSAPVTVTGSGEVLGFVLGALVTPGQWTYDVVDIGGNVLATGTIVAK